MTVFKHSLGSAPSKRTLRGRLRSTGLTCLKGFAEGALSNDFDLRRIGSFGGQPERQAGRANLLSLEGLPKSALPNLLDVGKTGKLAYQARHTGQGCLIHLPEAMPLKITTDNQYLSLLLSGCLAQQQGHYAYARQGCIIHLHLFCTQITVITRCVPDGRISWGDCPWRVMHWKSSKLYRPNKAASCNLSSCSHV